MTQPTPNTARPAAEEALRLAEEARRLAEEFGNACYHRKSNKYETHTAMVAAIDALAALAQPPEAPAAVEVSRLAGRDVLAERKRQISKEGWTPEHDDEHWEGDLSLAGAVYAVTKGPRDDVPPAWPWEAAAFKPRDWRANLVRAGALILAEIERLDRAKSKACNDPMCACRGGPCAECPEGQVIASQASTASEPPMCLTCNGQGLLGSAARFEDGGVECHECMGTGKAQAASEPVARLVSDPTDEQIESLWSDATGGSIVTEDMKAFARRVWGAATNPPATAAALATGEADTQRLNWLLPNLHPANFGMGFDWDTDEEFLAGWRAQIDQAIKESR